MAGRYVRNPKGTRSEKISDQDLEDFEQEKLIQQWLAESGAGEIELKHISRKGTARNTLVKASVRLDKASVRLDQKAFEDGARTFADLIAGSDGRDLFSGDDPRQDQRDPGEVLDENIDLFFDAIGASEGTKAWAKKSLRSADSMRSLRSLMKDEEQSLMCLTDLESEKPWGNFRG